MRLNPPAIVVTAALLTLVSFATQAKKAAPLVTENPATHWTQEPDGFLGIKFGEPFTVPRCPSDGTNFDPLATRDLGTLCYLDAGGLGGTLLNLPKLGFNYSVDVYVVSGKPVMFTLKTSPDNFPVLTNVLTQRYGAPMTAHNGNVTSNSGVQFDNVSLRWVGESVSL